MIKKKLLTLLLNGMVASCCVAYAQSYPPRETVLSAGQNISAKNKNGVFNIVYSGSVERTFGWNGHHQRVQMSVRRERFLGMLGIYNPADTIFAIAPRIVAQEAVRNFSSYKKADAFLRQGSNYMDWVYTKNGLVAGLGITPARRQVNIDVWQILIQGKKPSNLAGARPDMIVFNNDDH